MDKLRKTYQKPTVVQVSLVPEEAVLVVCKNHEVEGIGADMAHCSWPAGVGGGVCRGVTGS